MAQETAFLAALQGVGRIERGAQTDPAPGDHGAHVLVAAAAAAAAEAVPESSRPARRPVRA